MKRSIRVNLMLAILLALLATIHTGCGLIAWQPVDANADPVVVNAERADQSAFAIVDEFVNFEHENRAILPAEVTTFADVVRRKAPDAFRDLRLARATYKVTRDKTDAQTVEEKLAIVQDLARQARLYLANYRKG